MGTHPGTGFLATPYLLPVLADSGHLDLAYELLLPDTEPPWLVMIDRGATIVWEQRGGVPADGKATASLNHYSKGAVISFLDRYVAGLQLVEPGCRRFLVQPRVGGEITWAEAGRTAGSRHPRLCRLKLCLTRMKKPAVRPDEAEPQASLTRQAPTVGAS